MAGVFEHERRAFRVAAGLVIAVFVVLLGLLVAAQRGAFGDAAYSAAERSQLIAMLVFLAAYLREKREVLAQG